MSNLAQRILTSLIAVPLAVGAVYLGGWFFVGFIVLVGLLAQWDVYAMAEAGGIRPLKSVGLAVGALVMIRVVWAEALPLAVAGLVLAFIAELWRRPDETSAGPIPNVGALVFGVFYPAILVGYFVELRVLSAETLGDVEAMLVTVSAMAAVWAADTLAYFTGRAVGKRPLFPRISPKKTWAGSVGGVIGALILVAVMKVTLLSLVLSWADVVVIGLLCGAIGQLGDLAESMLKRSVGVKDSGNYLPGHGGMLDRIDAMLIAVPLVVLYLDHVRGLW